MQSLQDLSPDFLLNTAGTHYVGFPYCKKNVKSVIHSQPERYGESGCPIILLENLAKLGV